MRPIRLADAIAQVEESMTLHERESRHDRRIFARGRLAMLVDLADGGFIVTPSDEALARMRPSWSYVGTEHAEVGDDHLHSDGCEWVKAKAKVAALPETNHE